MLDPAERGLRRLHVACEDRFRERALQPRIARRHGDPAPSDEGCARRHRHAVAIPVEERPLGGLRDLNRLAGGAERPDAAWSEVDPRQTPVPAMTALAIGAERARQLPPPLRGGAWDRRALSELMVDPKPFFDEIASVDDAWAASTGRQDKIAVQREALAIPLRGLRKSAIGGRKRRDVHESRWTSGAAAFPSPAPSSPRSPRRSTAICRAPRSSACPPGARVYPHIDRGEYYRLRNRYHLVLKSSAGSWLKAGDEEVRMREGELWWFDNDQPHEAHNDGDEDRIHMIFDLLPRPASPRPSRSAPWRRCEAAMLDIAPMTDQRAAGDAGLRLRPGCGRHALPGLDRPPNNRKARRAPVVVVHGIARNAEGWRGGWRTGRWRRAARSSRRSSRRRFSGYQRAVCGARADRALLALLDALAADGTLPAGPVDLAGYSGGAQFAHRFAWLYPHRVGRLTLAAAGWWTFPDAAPFPYGLGPAFEGPAHAPRWLRANAAGFPRPRDHVAVGAEDCVPDANTRSGRAIDAQQGRDRLERARRWTAAIQAAAERFGLPPRASLRVLPGAGHSFQACADAGLDRLILPCGKGLCSLDCLSRKGATR
jgi:pimeloyl-ACP methyl ester carboxylesterase